LSKTLILAAIDFMISREVILWPDLNGSLTQYILQNKPDLEILKIQFLLDI